MENGLYRKKSVERISSPEELHDYMRVTSPRLWMILGAVVLLLAGFIVYASTATLENTIPIQVEVLNHDLPDTFAEQGGPEKVTEVNGTLPMSMKGEVEPGMKLRIGKAAGVVSYVIMYSDQDEITILIDMEDAYLQLPDGTYDAELVLESTTPFEFLWN